MSDQAARDEALNIEQSCIVQAPAGSGKTTLLISRYICLLAIVDQPEEVLAITFTRKATAEMRKRILDALDPEKQIKFPQEAANRAVEEVRRRSVELGWNILEQPSRLQIMTIDALCTSLIRRMPWASRFGSLPGVAEDSDRHYEAAVLNLYESADSSEELQSNLKVLLAHLDNNGDKLQELIVQLLKKRDQWLRRLVGAAFSIDDKRRTESHWQALLGGQLDKTRDMMPSTARELLKLEGMDNSQEFSLERWKLIANFMITTAKDWRVRITANDLSEQLALMPDTLKAALDACRGDDALKKRIIEIQKSLPKVCEYEDEQWQVLQACSAVLQHAVAELKLEFRKHGQVDFIEIAQQAVQALGDADNPSDLTLVLDYQYRHIMVDEFQDTSVSQRDLLERLTAGWQNGDGRTVFLVGDPMQSIYRFREAEVGIYLSVIENGLGDLRIKPLHLTSNFRSNKDVIDWFNSVFEPSFPARAELETGSVPYVSCTSEKENVSGHSATVWLQNMRVPFYTRSLEKKFLAGKEADQVLCDLRKFREANPGPEVRAAILVRSRKQADYIIARLTEENIRFYAPEFIALSQRPVVEDLLSLTRALLNLADRTSWAAVLRAPWCGLTLADLLAIAGPKRSIIWNRLNDAEVLSALSEEGQARVRRLRDVMQRTFAARGQLDIRQWIHDCWLLLGGPACYAPHDNENALLFLDLIERHARGNSIEGLHRFEENLESLYAVPEDSPDDTWLHISTMHGAKGLEYDAVFLPQFDSLPRGGSSKPLLAWSEFILEGRGPQMLLSPIVPTGKLDDGSFYKFLLDWNRKRELIELLRLAYVACTRAKDALYVYASGKFPKFDLDDLPDQPFGENSLIGMLWPGLKSSEVANMELRTYELPLEDTFDDFVTAKTFPLHRLPADWSLPEPPAPLALPGSEMESPDNPETIDFDWAGSTALWIGNVVHEWLEKIVRTGARNWNAERLADERSRWRVRLLSMGMSADQREMNDALDRIETALNNVLKDSTGQWILSDQHLESEAELRLTGHSGGQFANVILDRTFVDQEGTRWIIDYKSGTTGGNVADFLDQEVKRYRDQLDQYRTIVSGMDSRPIRTALYFPMFPAWREVQ